jgi:FHA domain
LVTEPTGGTFSFPSDFGILPAMSSRPDWNDENTSEISVAPLSLSSEQVPATLEMIQGPGAPRHHDLFRAESVIGRAIDVDIAINSTDLSRRHVMLKRALSGQVTLTDLDSRNGVFLNGVKIHSAVLHDGDSIQLGTIVFIFHEARVQG